jgi:serine/threonine-protein kinase
MAADALLTEGVREGDILAGKYRIDRLLGAGGMGVVVAAHHLHLDEHVAIKFLLPEVLDNAEIVGRFTREARAAVKIKSEHVARMIDVGTLDSGAPYMVMEYLDGYDLGTWLEQRGPLSIEQTVEFVLQACEAIAEAHGLGIVHRDLKPENLYCIRRPDGTLCIKVLDFGISKSTNTSISGSDLGMTKTTTIVGSPLYMSPEQLKSSRDVDRRTDVWALGVILFELLTGQVPFNGDSLPELCLAIVSEPTPPLRTLRPEVPVGLEQAVHKCLEKNRELRPDNVAELAIALAPFAPTRSRLSVERIHGITQSAGISSGAIQLPASVAPHAGVRATNVSWEHSATPRKAARWTWVLAGAIGTGSLVAAAIAVTLSLGGRKLQPQHRTHTNAGPILSAVASVPHVTSLPGRGDSTSVVSPNEDKAIATPIRQTPSAEPVVSTSGQPSDSPAVPKAIDRPQHQVAAPAKSTAAKRPTTSALAPRAKASTRAAAKRGVYDDMQ